MDLYCCVLCCSSWNTKGIWWILGCASQCGLEAKKSFSWPVVIHRDGVVWGAEREVILNAAYITELWHVSMCCAVFWSCPEGETHQSDVRATTESGVLETRLWFSSENHWSTYIHTPSSKWYCKQKRCLKAQIMMWKAQIYSIHVHCCTSNLNVHIRRCGAALLPCYPSTNTEL